MCTDFGLCLTVVRIETRWLILLSQNLLFLLPMNGVGREQRKNKCSDFFSSMNAYQFNQESRNSGSGGSKMRACP